MSGLTSAAHVNLSFAHLKFFTVSTRAAMFSSLASGGTPWPRLKIWPRAPRISVRIRPVSAATISGLRQEQRWIKIALHANVFRQLGAHVRQPDRPVNPQHIRAGVHQRRPSGHDVHGKNDDGHGAFQRGNDLLDPAGRCRRKCISGQATRRGCRKSAPRPRRPGFASADGRVTAAVSFFISIEKISGSE